MHDLLRAGTSSCMMSMRLMPVYVQYSFHAACSILPVCCAWLWHLSVSVLLRLHMLRTPWQQAGSGFPQAWMTAAWISLLLESRAMHSGMCAELHVFHSSLVLLLVCWHCRVLCSTQRGRSSCVLLLCCDGQIIVWQAPVVLVMVRFSWLRYGMGVSVRGPMCRSLA